MEVALKISMTRRTLILAGAFISATLRAAAAVSDPKVPPQPPLVTANADGTVIVQKVPPKGTAKYPTSKNGLVIPRQVVVPIAAPRVKQP